jgi:CheY-like chemotaxis protein
MNAALASSLRVLHVEDDPAIRAVASIALAKVGGFQLKSCAGGSEALQSGPEFDPHILLLDVMMPGMDGPATLAGLATRMKIDGRLILFMTAKVQPSDLEQYRSYGAHGVIIKPFDAMRLHLQVMEHWRALNARH